MEYNGNPRVTGNGDVQVNRPGNNKVMGKKPGKKFMKSPSNMVVAAFFAAVAVLVAAVLVFMVVGGKSESDLIKKDKYQAVFLSDTSGQVYFGKLKSLNARYYELTDIYYVKVENAVQPDRNNTAAQNISLAKLGNELHGPEDVMYISRDKVLFWENLKDDGQVVKAITEFKKNGAATSSQSQTQQQSSGQQQQPANSNQNTTPTNSNSTINR